ncbi:MAG: DNA mismatch repair protein MutS [Candidatus Cloacimonetes bacterium 4572_55]|nr:MAG: DNA mismatch repair protein MutS [Candidatus Cloacimonetes bacterium 4572_55]
MEQYWSIKKDHPDTLLLYRMGDFYEMFDEDAKLGSRLLGITLTARNHGKGNENIPLAGFPFRQLENYLTRLIKSGQRVAVCEQVEDPKLAKGLVKREVIEIISPGTALNTAILEDKKNIFLSGVYIRKKMAGFSYIDLSTGEFFVTEVDVDRLREEFERIMPAETVVPPTWYHSVDHLAFKEDFPGTTFQELDGCIFNQESAFEELTSHFKTISLEGFGCGNMTVGVSAAGAALHYVKQMQKTSLVHITQLSPYHTTDYMILDSQTKRNLELVDPLREGESGETTLLTVCDHTKTAMGGRRLRQWLVRPLLDARKINLRLSAVEELTQSGYVRTVLQEQLGDLYDLERLIARVAVGKANARDLLSLKTSLQRLPALIENISPLSSPLLMEIKEQLDPMESVTDQLERAIKEGPPIPITEGGLIKKEYNSELDELRAIAFDGKSWIAGLQNTERERSGIPSLKIGYNRVFGYYIEISNAHKNSAPEDYIRKQTLRNAERYITPELKEFEARVLTAEEKICELEYRLFLEIRDQVGKHVERIQKTARAVARLDVISGFASLALENRYSKPKVTNDNGLHIVDGRHPVVEHLLPTGAFVPNDCDMDSDDAQILLITGPNMAGKSTYLRQVGLIVLLAQIGSYVPAKEATIGVTDRIFTRVGAQDNLARGESTFLVEMNETAYILHNATSQSLVLLDEIGRGTSTFDGLSIAWAVTEYLHTNKKMHPKTMFATHYHELTELAQILPRIRNYNVAVEEWKDDIVFLRKIIPGGSDRSYGIQVARLAGMPKEVIARAKEVLINLEESELNATLDGRRSAGRKGFNRMTSQLSLFAPPPEKIIVKVQTPHPVVDHVRRIDPDSLTPREALEMLYRLKDQVRGSE